MRPEFAYGLIAGLIWWAWMGIEELLGLHGAHIAIGQYTGWLYLVLQFVVVVQIVRIFHRKFPLGRIEPIQAVKHAAFVSAVFGVMVYIGTLAFVNFLKPDWLQHLLTWKVAQMRTAGIAEEQIRAQIVTTREAYGPLGLALTCFVINPLLGSVVGMVTAMVVNWRWEKANLPPR